MSWWQALAWSILLATMFFNYALGVRHGRASARRLAWRAEQKRFRTTDVAKFDAMLKDAYPMTQEVKDVLAGQRALLPDFLQLRKDAPKTGSDFIVPVVVPASQDRKLALAKSLHEEIRRRKS